MVRTKGNTFWKNLFFLIGCVAAFITSMLITSSLVPERAARVIEGFDFSPVLRLEDETNTGLKVGEVIDLSSLVGKDGQSLANLIDSTPVVLAIITPDCGMCVLAKDEMKYIRENLSPSGTQYYITSFTYPDAESVFRYSDASGVGAQTFIWKADQELPEAFLAMVVPYHVLVDSKGTIIRKWPGSHADEGIRDRMARQIVTDILAELSSR